MKCAWEGGAIRIRNAETRFREAGSQTRPVSGGRLERDFICDGCPQGLATYDMNLEPPRMQCFWEPCAGRIAVLQS